MNQELDDFLEKYKEFLPEDFDWEFYINYYSDIRSAGLNNEKLAKYHYINWGRKEDRYYCYSKILTGYNKIFQIGFNKCGTTSIHNLFDKKTNLKSIHWDNGDLALSIYNNIQSGEYLPLDQYNEYVVYTDMECFLIDSSKISHIMIGKNYFDILDINYPNSLFIFNTRSIEHWIKSRISHRFFDAKRNEYYKYLSLYKEILKNNKTSYVIDFWKNQYNEHYNNTIEYFSRSPNQLLIFDIEKDSFDKFRSFFKARNIDINSHFMPHDNRSS